MTCEFCSSVEFCMHPLRDSLVLFRQSSIIIMKWKITGICHLLIIPGKPQITTDGDAPPSRGLVILERPLLSQCQCRRYDVASRFDDVFSADSRAK